MMSGVQHDVLLRLQRWRQRLEHNHSTDREAAARLTTVARAIDEIATLRRNNDVLRNKLETLERVVMGGSGRGMTR
jgi:transposase-like protein